MSKKSERESEPSGNIKSLPGVHCTATCTNSSLLSLLTGAMTHNTENVSAQSCAQSNTLAHFRIELKKKLK